MNLYSEFCKKKRGKNQNNTPVDANVELPIVAGWNR
jgi:hypothetical protein